MWIWLGLLGELNFVRLSISWREGEECLVMICHSWSDYLTLDPTRVPSIESLVVLPGEEVGIPTGVRLLGVRAPTPRRESQGAEMMQVGFWSRDQKEFWGDNVGE